MPIIETSSLSRTFGKTVAVDGISLKVEAGEVLGLLGPNGAGKTTTIRMLAGMIAPTSGKAIVGGMDPARDPSAVHQIIGLLTESPGFYSRMSAIRNLEFFAGFYPSIDVPRQVEKYLRMFGLWERRKDKVGGFSKGMKQRLALCRALVHEPQVLFLDEPTSGLDPEAAAEVRDTIRKLSAEGHTILLCTHNLAEAESLCSRIAIIRTRLLALDTTENLRRRFFQRHVIVEVESEDAGRLQKVKSLGFVRDARAEGNTIIVELSDPERNHPDLVKALVESGARVINVSEKQYPLEEVYLKLVREEAQN